LFLLHKSGIMDKCSKCGQLNGVHKMGCETRKTTIIMEKFTLYYTFNGKKYKSTVEATDRLHAMNLIRNKIEFLSEPNKASNEFIDFFNDMIKPK